MQIFLYGLGFQVPWKVQNLICMKQCSIHRSRAKYAYCTHPLMSGPLWNSPVGMNLQFICFFPSTIFNTFISILLFCLFLYVPLKQWLRGPHVLSKEKKNYLQPCLAYAWLPPPSHRFSGLRGNNKFHYDTLVCCSLSRGGTCDSWKFFNVNEDRCCRLKQTSKKKTWLRVCGVTVT